MKKFLSFGMALAGIALLGGCCLFDPLYYKTMETFGQEKRDILVKQVTKARNEQEDTQQVFQDALEQFGSVVQFDGGDLQKEYEKMSAELKRCEGRANAVKERIDAVEHVAGDLFAEWKVEIGEYQNAEYKRDSKRKMAETQQNYERMLKAMRNAEAKIEPVLAVFRDQVLYLKHNLNARALASLQNESTEVTMNVQGLLNDLNKAIAEADSFINTMVE